MANKIYINAYKILNELFGDSDYSIKDLTTSDIILKLLSCVKGTFNTVEFTIRDDNLITEPNMFDCMTKTIYTFAMVDPGKMFQRDCAKHMIEKMSETFNVNSLRINLDNVYLEHDDMSGFKYRVRLHISLSLPSEDLEEDNK